MKPLFLSISRLTCQPATRPTRPRTQIGYRLAGQANLSLIFAYFRGENKQLYYTCGSISSETVEKSLFL